MAGPRHEVLAVLATMLGAGSVAGQYGETYQSRKEGFSITGPPGWSMIKGAGPTNLPLVRVVFIGPDCPRLPADMNVASTETCGMSLNELVETALSALETHTDAEILSENNVTIGGLDAREIVYTYKLLFGGPTVQGWTPAPYGTLFEGSLKAKAFALVEGDMGYVITYGASPEVYDEYVDVFDASAATFRIMDTWVEEISRARWPVFAIVGGIIALEILWISSGKSLWELVWRPLEAKK